MNYVKSNFLSLVVLLAMVLFFFMFFKGCFTQSQQATDTKTSKSDTVYSIAQSAAPIPAQPIVIATQQPSPAQTNTIREIIYKNDTAAINEILTKYFSKNAYTNVLKIDTIGTVQVSDTISQNTIVGRSYTYNLRYPVITNTVTIDHPYKPVNAVYIGAGVSGTQLDLVSAFKAGLIFKNKKDNLFEVNATVNKGLSLGAEIGFYKKISFRKQ